MKYWNELSFYKKLFGETLFRKFWCIEIKVQINIFYLTWCSKDNKALIMGFEGIGDLNKSIYLIFKIGPNIII